MYKEFSERLFRTYELSNTLDMRLHQVTQIIESENSDELARMDREEYLSYIQNKCEIPAPVLLEDQIHCNTRQAKIEVYDHFNSYVYVDGVEIVVYIPFSGDPDLILSKASTWSTSAPNGRVQGNEIVVVFHKTISEAESFDLAKALEPIISGIKQHISFLDNDLTTYNNSIRRVAENAIDRKLKNHTSYNNLLKNIPYPMKKRDNQPSTFEVPQVKKKPTITRPKLAEQNIKPEPTLGIEIYEHILKICSDMTLVMERTPSAFINMDEEALRTHFLFQLNGHYEGKASGETFNGLGKTDIIIREDNQNIFIAECKYWHGEKAYAETIDQLLGYVTYRDTKTAIFMFVKNKNFSEVLTKIQSATAEHPNFVSQDKPYKPPLADTGFRYVFKNKNDQDKHFLLTVMAFHVPTKE